MSSERDERKWVQYVNAYGQTSDWSEPPPVSVDAADVRSMVAKDEVTDYFTQLDAAEAAMQSWLRRYCDVAVHDIVITEASDLDTAVVTATESKCAAIRALNLEGVDPYAACAMTEEEYTAAVKEWEVMYANVLRDHDSPATSEVVDDEEPFPSD